MGFVSWFSGRIRRNIRILNSEKNKTFFVSEPTDPILPRLTTTTTIRRHGPGYSRVPRRGVGPLGSAAAVSTFAAPHDGGAAVAVPAGSSAIPPSPPYT